MILQSGAISHWLNHLFLPTFCLYLLCKYCTIHADKSIFHIENFPKYTVIYMGDSIWT